MTSRKKLISIVSGCYNEFGNISELYARIVAVMHEQPQYDFEIILIDNCSSDGTRDEIRDLCAKDTRVKAIFNTRNFGFIRSPWYALLQAYGDAVISISSDLEEPPELISQMLSKWEEGYKLAILTYVQTEERGIMPLLRRTYYWLIDALSEVRQARGASGSGLYDKSVVDTFRSLDEPYPYVRGLLCDLGWKRAEIPFVKKTRSRGISKGRFFTCVDVALLGIVNQSRLPLRFATYIGVVVAGISFLAGLYYLIAKLINWDSFQMGLAPMGIGLFFLMGILFLLLGLIGEYIGQIFNHVVKRPVVVEEVRINFDADKQD